LLNRLLPQPMNKKELSSEQQQFSEILQQIQSAKKRAVQQVNNTLVELYWNIGKHISSQVELDHWGKNTVEQLAKFIQNKAPEIKGFSSRNLWRMKQFYEVYGSDTKLSTLWSVLPWSHNRRIMALKTPEEREFYLRLCQEKNYSFRELEG
jgi:predicted nuclease of restriction endonuclease-like (RecB) superfamily